MIFRQNQGQELALHCVLQQKLHFIKSFAFFHYIFFSGTKNLMPGTALIVSLLAFATRATVFFSFQMLCKQVFSPYVFPGWNLFFWFAQNNKEFYRQDSHYDQKRYNSDIRSLHFYKLFPLVLAKMYFPYWSCQDKCFD